MTSQPVICLGEAMVELSLSRTEPASPHLGYAGDTFNTAIYLKRMAPELPVGYATKIGTDPLSDGLAALMRSEGLETGLVLRDPARLPGLYAISTDDRGERSFMYWRNASAARAMLAAPGLSFDALAQARMIYFSAISLAILPDADRAAFLAWLPRYRAQGGIVAFDSNYRPALWPDRTIAQTVIAATWAQTDLAFPSVDDEMALFGDADTRAVLRRLAGLGVRAGALKRGAEGPLSLSGADLGPFDPAPQVIDSTAAGDSFNGGYMAAHLAGQDEAACLQAGHALARRVVQVRGAILPRTGEATG